MKKISAIMILFMGFFLFASQTDASGSQLIIINKKTNTLAFYDGGTLVKTFRVATGRQASFTPEGTFKIVNKIKNRPYYTKNIAGGDPRNPLGDRWMGLEARGTYGTTYGIHGNSNEGSIGGYVSSGCVRMHNQEIRWLFDQVQVYTTVVITRSDNSFDAIAQASGYIVTVPASADSTNGIIPVQNGWIQNGNKKYYYENGAVKKGWQTISGKRYFFDGNGVIKTGWLEDGGNKYFFDADGVMKTGWLDEGGNRYFLDSAGVMKTGWWDEGEKRHFLDPTGVMKIGWLEDGGKNYYFDNTGAMKTNWVEEEGKWYYFDQTGVMMTGWVNDQGKWFYTNTSGFVDASIFILNSPDNNGDNKPSWLDASRERYFQNSTRELVMSWVKYGENWYYLYVSKEMAESSQIESY
ncbi:cell surface protein [Neobacillus bataviensis LMG 21833]|uniref:Cell surface protein n=1 Tax=Neobacillus bataviensis LMG 21833 TaxID=1117379 RepID=K6D2Y0_9BACI|nr:L,D-transpeptidase family protein [Neobacillus bataviensis]EKN62408.1 cell surface protein [Neobacillus bataviensis LMG 21833]